MKILYCFKIDELTAKIVRYEITDYEIYKYHGGMYIKFKASLGNKNNSKFEVPFNDLDKIYHMKLYTFNPDYNYAKKIINDDLINRRNSAYKEYDRYNELIIHLNKNHQI